MINLIRKKGRDIELFSISNSTYIAAAKFVPTLIAQIKSELPPVIAEDKKQVWHRIHQRCQASIYKTRWLLIKLAEEGIDVEAENKMFVEFFSKIQTIVTQLHAEAGIEKKEPDLNIAEFETYQPKNMEGRVTHLQLILSSLKRDE